MTNRKTAKQKAEKTRQGERERQESELAHESAMADLFAAKERKRIDHAFGMETEERFFSAFRRPNIDLPAWLYGVRRASPKDDAQGIDAFAITDIGEIAIQIKSSIRGMFRFNEKRPGNQITVLVISRDLSPANIVERVVERVERERQFRGSRRVGRRDKEPGHRD